MGFPSGSEIKNLPANTGNAGDRFNPWVGKIPLRRKWQPIPLFLPGKSPWTEDPGGVQSMGLQLSDWAHTRTHCINMTFIYLNWETKKFMWLTLLQYSLYCSSLQTHNISKECTGIDKLILKLIPGQRAGTVSTLYIEQSVDTWKPYLSSRLPIKLC